MYLTGFAAGKGRKGNGEEGMKKKGEVRKKFVRCPQY